MKVVINNCYGGFGLSDEAFEAYLNRKGIKFRRKRGSYLTHYERPPNVNLDPCYIDRHDPDMVAVVEEMGERANGKYSNLKVVDIPFDSGEGWHIIDDGDGYESVHEDHRIWP